MQNTDTADNIDNLNKFDNLQLTQPASLESLTCEQRKLLTDSPKAADSRIVHSDPEETQAKAKTRSRFSAALRKLSRSTRKKEKSATKGHSSATATESSELIVSSGAEDLPDTSSGADSGKKSKKKKKSSKSIFSLKKSKVAPKPEEESTVLNVEEPEQEENENEETVKLLQPIFQDNENELIVTTEKLSPQVSRSQVQITIKSKKIETVASSQERLNKNPSPTSSRLPSSSSPTNTVQTGENKIETTITDNLTVSSSEPTDKKKKLKTKITTQTPQKSTVTAQSKSKQQQDEIRITQSSKDTPPKERAPTKPSRLTITTTPTSATTTTSQSGSSSGAVRKTATTTRAAIKLATAAKSKQKAKTAKGSNSPGNTNNNSNALTSAVTVTATTTDLMINPQRGHRLPRPTSTTTTAIASTISTSTIKESQVAATDQAIDDTTTNELPINQTTQQHQQQQRQLITTPTTPDSLAIANLPQTSAEIQSSSTNASLPSPPTPPPPLPPTTTTAHRQQQHQKENLKTSPSDSSVQSKTFPQTDDRISLAESVKTGILFGDNSTPYDSRELIKEPISAVHFAVGSPVRPLFQKALYEYSLQDTSLDLDKDLIDPDTAITEANRRRIQYISQPTLYDEFNSLELKRSHYRYQSGVSDLSLDTDENTAGDTFDDTQPMPAFGDLTMDQDMEPVRVNLSELISLCRLTRAIFLNRSEAFYYFEWFFNIKFCEFLSPDKRKLIMNAIDMYIHSLTN